MSGGSHNYIYNRIKEDLCGQMEDAELNDLIDDIAKLAKSLEWYHSADTNEESYRKEVVKFKKKWFEQERKQRLKNYIDNSVEKLRKELYQLLAN